MILNVQRHLKCWLWRLASLLGAEHKFNCGITGLRREDVNGDARPGRPSTSTTAKNIEAVIVESQLERLLMMLAYRSAYAKQYLRMF